MSSVPVIKGILSKELLSIGLIISIEHNRSNGYSWSTTEGNTILETFSLGILEKDLGDIFLLVLAILSKRRDIKPDMAKVASSWKTILKEEPQESFNLTRCLKFPNPKVVNEVRLGVVVIDSRVL